MIQYITIVLANPNGIYDEYQITSEELNWLKLMADEGKEQEAIDILVSEFIIPAGTKYQDIMSNYLSESASGVLKKREGNSLARNIMLLSLGLSATLIYNFSAFMREVYAKRIFDMAELTDEKVQNALLEDVLTDFEQRISGAMSQTQTFILNGIRTLQREMIAENFILRNGQIKGEALDAQVELFRESLASKYPELYNAMANGNILVSRKFGPDGEQVRHYKVDYYTEMATRTTLLNVDRNTNVIMAMVNGDRVVEFYLSDPRKVKKDREICQEILHTITMGKSLLAIDDEAAKILGIMTVDEAQSTPDYSFGPFCRHTIRRVSNGFLQEINKLLEKVA